MRTALETTKRFDEVDRAQAVVGRQVGGIVAVLDRGDVPAAARAATLLTGLGRFAVASLARALPRARSSARGMAIVAVLEAAGQDGAPAEPVLRRAARRANDPAVRFWAADSLLRLIGGPRFRGPVPGADGRPPEAYWRERLVDVEMAVGPLALLAVFADVRRARLRVDCEPVPEQPGPRSAHDDELDRAVGSLEKAANRLIQLLDRKEPETFGKAALTLVDIGPFAVGPLASALLAAPDPRNRGLMVAVLGGLAARVPGCVMAALVPAIAREDDPLVLETARALHAALLARQAGDDGPAAI
jgi:hypothetical protein